MFLSLSMTVWTRVPVTDHLFLFSLPNWGGGGGGGRKEKNDLECPLPLQEASQST